MTEPTPLELQQAEVARQAMDKGFMLVTHMHFSLLKNGTFAVDQVDSLDEVSEYLSTQP